MDRPVSLSPHVVRLRPAPHCRTPILAYSLTVKPSDHFVNWQQDPFGNYLARFVFPERATALEIVVDLIADMTVINPFDFFIDEQANRFPFEYEPSLHADLTPYLGVLADGDGRLAEWMSSLPDYASAAMNTIDVLVDLNQPIARQHARFSGGSPRAHAPDVEIARLGAEGRGVAGHDAALGLDQIGPDLEADFAERCSCAMAGIERLTEATGREERPREELPCALAKRLEDDERMGAGDGAIRLAVREVVSNMAFDGIGVVDADAGRG